MTSIRKPASVVFGIAVTVCAVLPTAASAQTSPNLPRDNVAGGTIASRRPGNWIQSGNAVVSERISTSITNFGGVDYTQEGPPPSIRDAVLPALVEIFLGAIDQLSLLIQAAILGTTTTGT